ncbi:MAG: glycosyltransferase family 2 protein [Candidatus Poribacteria bacterium]|nr:glycosyltransferase family 2 protein [Candidatus Poribacteria bacterium]
MGHKLSIVIPVYNEIDTLHEILRQVKAVDVGIEKEIILIDDYSTDGTHGILKEIEASGDKSIRIFHHKVNQGKGAALRTGFQHVTGDVTIIQDADVEYDPQDYPKLIQPILAGEADVVYGSRFTVGKQRALLSSYAANKFLTFISNLFTGLQLTDMETCYKVIRTSILREIPLRSDRFGFEPEITAKLAKRKCRILEIPITYRGRDYAGGKKVSWKDGVAALFHIIRFRFKD